MTFDDFSAGSGTTKDSPDLEANDKDNINADAENDDFEEHSDEALKILLNQLGGTSDDVKEIKVDLDLTKP